MKGFVNPPQVFDFSVSAIEPKTAVYFDTAMRR